MKIRQRKYPSGHVGWQVDVSGVGPDGAPFRTRFMAPEHVTSRSGAQRWGEEQRRRLERGEVPATPRAARKAAREREAASREAAEADALAGATVAQAVAWFVEDGVVDRCSPTTVRLRQRICADHLVPSLGARPVRDLGEADVRALKVRLADHSAGFARLVLRMLRGLVKSARARGVPCELSIALPRDESADEAPRAYDPAGFEAIVAAARTLGPQHLAVVLLGGEGGLRRAEILGLQVRDGLAAGRDGRVKVERVRVRVDGPDLVVKVPKTGKVRAVPLSPRCASAVAALAAGREAEPDAWLLRKERCPAEPAGESTPRDLLASAQRAAGFPAVGPHAARHTALSHMLASGSDLRTVQEIAGHRLIATTARYLHALPEQVARAGAKVEAWRAEAAGAAPSMAPQPRKRAKSRAREEIPAPSPALGTSAALGTGGAQNARSRPPAETPSTGS